jgi:hypothetical protein
MLGDRTNIPPPRQCSLLLGLDGKTTFGADAGRVAFQPLLHAHRGVQRALRLVFMRDRCAEQREDSIAGGLGDVAAVALHRLHHGLSAGSKMARASLGSRSSISSIEPLMSAKSAVTVLRSPSRLSLTVLSIRRIDESFGFLGEAAADRPSDVPHSSQTYSTQFIVGAALWA